MTVLPITISLNSFFTPAGHNLPTPGQLACVISNRVQQVLSEQILGVMWGLNRMANVMVRENEAYIQCWIQAADFDDDILDPAEFNQYVIDNHQIFFNEYFGWHFPSIAFHYPVLMLNTQAIGGEITMGVAPLLSLPPVFNPAPPPVFNPAPVEEDEADQDFVEVTLADGQVVQAIFGNAVTFQEWGIDGGAGMTTPAAFTTEGGAGGHGQGVMATDTWAVTGTASATAVDTSLPSLPSAASDAEAFLLAGGGFTLSLKDHINKSMSIISKSPSVVNWMGLEVDGVRMLTYLMEHSSTDISWLTSTLKMTDGMVSQMSTEMGHSCEPVLYPGSLDELRTAMYDYHNSFKTERTFDSIEIAKRCPDYFTLVYRFLVASCHIYPIGGVDKPSGLLVWIDAKTPVKARNKEKGMLPNSTSFAAIDKEIFLEDMLNAFSHETHTAHRAYAHQKEVIKQLFARTKAELDEAKTKVPNVIELKIPYTWS